MNRTIVGVGSNIQPWENIAKAKELLEKKYSLIQSSSFLETQPIGFSDQANFINGVFLVETSLEQSLFKKALQEIETILKKNTQGNRYGPRTIDLDIVVWNGKITDAHVHEWPFLKEAVLEVWPDLKF